ncbi:transporter substrate-binding domain-containing protein [Pseudomonas simiae]|uniref:transporter substrate-binding domain-containing protein n=1 Tax=Pseudomonas simiae TaxID=321846 RepID=UPI002733B93C|nr:transporter substrate-binding domain-containing protein [Pseudomonas simiae]WLG33563.1 transporter substrate-binding domain-containing protein [Pseudomonas simiae]WLI23536.1 transporter substrate-binding domain-containing protein [Pseudomonas simiae]
MSLFLRKWMALLVLGIALSGNVLADSQAGTFQVLGRSHVDGYQAVLTEDDWSWLRSKDVLVLGDSTPDYAPLGMVNNGRDYEGVTADYAQLLSELLRVQVQVRRYASRAEVIDGLKRGEVDFLGIANGYEAADVGLLLSTAYAEDMPALVTRLDDSHALSPNLAGKKIAMLYHYLSPEAVKAFYPKATLQLFPSTLSAIGAVAFGSADVYLGDALSANFLINKNYLNNVQLADFSRIEASNFSFAMTHDNMRMQRVLNRALAAIPVTERMNIQRRWSAGGSSMQGRKALHFSSSEQRWMDAHPLLRVAVDDSFLPLSFLNEDGEFRGISADVLAKVSLRTGLKFELLHAGSVADMIEKVRANEADLLITLTPSTSREGVLRFTRPYLNTPYVLVSGNHPSSPNTLDEMAGKRLAVIHGNPVRDLVIEQHPKIVLVEARNAQEVMALVAGGDADAGVNSLIIARYMISHQYSDQLRITSTVGTQLARTAFATSRGSLELYSIMEKALLSIPPEELDEVTNRWRSEIVVDDSYWLRNRAVIIQGFALASLLLIVAIGWIAYLRMLMLKRKQAEVALNDQLEFMRVLIDGTPHPIYVRDRQGQLVLCNSGYLNAFEVDREAVIGKTVMAGVLSNPSEAASYHEDYLQAMEEGVPRVQDRCLTMRSGQVLMIYHWMLPYRGSDGEVNGMIGGWIDISERQHLLEALREAKEHADDASRAKTTFLATMSHEIRTPMNAIIGMLELVQKKADQGYMDRASIEVASNAAHGLLDLIGDILDIVRIESGRLSLAPERANLLVLLESVARIFEGLARQKQLRLILDLDATLNCSVLVDPLRFKQVVSNLLSNAIKFTAVGQVRLSVSAEPSRNDERLAICLRVEDSGSGISLDDQQRLFNPFSQAGNHEQAGRSGSGLGLMISRTLCEMMGGTLTLSSVLGQGTKVEVRIALPTLLPFDEPAPSSAVVTPLAQELTVLVIDDYPANRLLLTQQLNFLGHRVSDAADGAHGLRAWRSQHFDVVITDCSMPVMNGYELARAIRDEERIRGLAPGIILGLTANAQPEEKNRCAEAGMDDCLFKPVSLNDLSVRLASLIPANAVDPLEQEPLPPTIDGIDLTSLVRLSRGDEAAIRSLLQDLATSNEQDMAQLVRLFTQHDLSGLSDLAHRVKGGARIIQAHALIECCEALEAGCKELNSAVLNDAVDALQQAMEQLGQRLEVYLA